MKALSSWLVSAPIEPVLEVVVDPGLTPAERDEQTLRDPGLVLGVEADLPDRLDAVLVNLRHRDFDRVVGIEDVERRRLAIAVYAVGRRPGIVEPDQELVVDRAEARIVFGLVVDGKISAVSSTV